MKEGFDKTNNPITPLGRFKEYIALGKIGPTKQEFFIFLGVSIGVGLLLTVNDYEIFESYPLPIMEQCSEVENPIYLLLRDIKPDEVNSTLLLYHNETNSWSKPSGNETDGKLYHVNMTWYMNITNRDYFCDYWKDKLGVEEGSQLDFGIPHWKILTLNFLIIGAVLGGVRIATAWLWQNKGSNRVMHKWKLLMGVVWFFSANIWFYFGWLDGVYYMFKRELIFGVELDHLNGLGLFNFTQWLFSLFPGTNPNVGFWDLATLAILGIIIFLVTWIVAREIIIRWEAESDSKQKTEETKG